MDAKRFAVLAGACWMVCFSTGCGGSQEGPKAPRRSAEAIPDGNEPSAEQPGDSYCSDGTCFRCGDSFCPRGWYCDEKVAGGPACSWIADCASEATCSCVSQALGASCRCEERDRGTYVSCGD